MSKFRKELEELINKHSRENVSDTPDFILADYLYASLEAFDKAVYMRDKFRGGGGSPSPAIKYAGVSAETPFTH